ncbi:MAG: hypothetical protein PVG53_03675 [Holophagae bacterium]|jgi:hypothetical protein
MNNLVKVLLVVLLSVASVGADELDVVGSVVGVPLTGDEAVEFLTHAEVVGEAERFDEQAITGPVRVTLSDGRRTYRAIFKQEDTRYDEFSFSDGRVVTKARDSYRHEIAAYELSRLLGLDIVPPCVERTIDSTKGSLCFWVEGSMTEAERRHRGLQSSNPEKYKDQLHEIELFQQLIADLDYSDLRNLVVDQNLKIHKVDSSMAFDPDPHLLTGLDSSRVSRRLFEGLKGLDKTKMEETLEPWLHKDELSGVWRRRAKILKRVDRLIKDYGEGETLY